MSKILKVSYCLDVLPLTFDHMLRDSFFLLLGNLKSVPKLLDLGAEC